VLLNLANNAVKFTARGEVEVRVRAESPTPEGRVPLALMVRDTGVGIPADRMDRLFQSFSQVDASTTRKFGGTGLGLAISHALVERMGGSIEVTSTDGQGSTFVAYIELKVGVANVAVTPDIRFHGTRALVVDDHHTNRVLCRDLLESWGCDVVACASGSEALERMELDAANGRAFQLAVIDHEMPGMNGIQLARLIKTEPKLSHVKMILGASSPSSRAKIDPSLFVASVAKPVKQSMLHQAVCKAMDVIRPVTGNKLERFVPQQRRAKLLLVEDNVVNQRVAGRLLEKAGYELEIAENGRIAVERASQGGYDAILMDCQMPEMDGFEATRRIRVIEGGERRVPIIAMTAGAMHGDRDRCVEAGMDDYLSKPVRSSELFAALDRHLDAPERVAEGG
jgi:two-component system, sensor histidine kinase and response regulator